MVICTWCIFIPRLNFSAYFQVYRKVGDIDPGLFCAISFISRYHEKGILNDFPATSAEVCVCLSEEISHYIAAYDSHIFRSIKFSG